MAAVASMTVRESLCIYVVVRGGGGGGGPEVINVAGR
jgi:hypothetical protein